MSRDATGAASSAAAKSLANPIRLVAIIVSQRSPSHPHLTTGTILTRLRIERVAEPGKWFWKHTRALPDRLTYHVRVDGGFQVVSVCATRLPVVHD
ncbi:hypothetical protein ACFRU3_48040 [Streptomyces sp. NPDC056910]|uniref:hypothetical protein n=1 Tax=Streptomyces sp. NPDC056910 TaxID=3345964 RepID=UPI0036AF2D9F